jgi:hypothetical protein
MRSAWMKLVVAVGWGLLIGGCGIFENDESDAQRRCFWECRSGCCTEAGRCIAGTTEAACGSGGDACQICPTNQRCENAAAGGRCKPCSQLNCDGCCASDGRCLAGTSKDACGWAGSQCVSCPGHCEPRAISGGACK